jgi:hypothetical protein
MALVPGLALIALLTIGLLIHPLVNGSATLAGGHAVLPVDVRVVPLRPWATASAYVVHAGDHVQFDVHGFALGEFVEAYRGSTYVGHSNGPTDGRGDADGLGPFTIPSACCATPRPGPRAGTRRGDGCPAGTT